MHSTHNSQSWITSTNRLAVNWQDSPQSLEQSYPVESYQPGYLTEAEDEWVRIAFNIRIQYYYHLAPKELLSAWSGACWCSDAPIGDFAYGPGPDDPWLPARFVQAFFHLHEGYVEALNPARRRLDSMDEETLNRQCLVLALFEMIANQGLDESHRSPLFSRSIQTVQDLIDLPGNELIRDLTWRSYRLYDAMSRNGLDSYLNKEGLELFCASVRPAPHETAARLRIMNYGDSLMCGAA
ncbi:MAG: hypothetical protein P9L94_02210 [Candidatus Hinthialibacter antarcticus]|nr:hypothetical protein [Candidatus Hinthialibacter antarcticus]